MAKCKKCNREATWKGLCDRCNEEKALVEESDKDLKLKKQKKTSLSWDDLMRM